MAVEWERQFQNAGCTFATLLSLKPLHSGSWSIDTNLCFVPKPFFRPTSIEVMQKSSSKPRFMNEPVWRGAACQGVGVSCFNHFWFSLRLWVTPSCGPAFIKASTGLFQACASPCVVIWAHFKLYNNVSCEQGLSARGRRRGGLWESVEQQQTSSVSGTSWAESPPPALITWLLCFILPPSGVLGHILKLLRVLTKASCEVNKDLQQVHWKCDFVFAAEVFQSRSTVGSYVLSRMV